jgi:hypothetical protein
MSRRCAMNSQPSRRRPTCWTCFSGRRRVHRARRNPTGEPRRG